MINQLAKLPLFYDICPQYLKKLVTDRQIIYHSFYKGVTVHEQHSECHGIDLVLSGKLVAYALSPNGSETIVFEFKNNNIIGANLLFGQVNKYPMNIYCKTDCEIFNIPKSTVLELLKNYSFVIQFIKSLSLNSQGMNERIAMYTQKTLRENLVDYLSALSTTQNSDTVFVN